MWIQDLILRNIQSFKDERLLFSKKINVIIGKNNTGKSTIIRSLLNFQQGGAQKSELLIRKFEKEAFVLATTIEPHSIPTFKKLEKDETQAILFGNTTGYWWLNFNSKLPPNNEVLSFAQKVKRDGGQMEFSPYSDSEPGNAFLPFLAKRKTHYTHQGQFDDVSVRRIDSDFRNLPTKLNRAKSNTLSTEFIQACMDILNFVPSTLPGQQNMNLATIGQYVGADESITMEQMGDGVAQTVGLLVNLFQVKDKIFLIEEVENDLHPEALKKLLALIIKSSEYNQFIISTHSSIVMRILGSEPETKIFETKSELVKDKISNTELFSSTINVVPNSPDERVRILYDLGYELVDSHLWDGYLILEESSAEKIIQDFLIPCFTPKLVGKLGTIAARGAGDVERRFSNLHSLFTYIHTTRGVYKNKAWVLVDGDEAGRDAISKLQNAFKENWAPKHFKTFSKENFEDFYPEEYKSRIALIEKEGDGRKQGKMKLDLAKEIVAEYLVDPAKTSKKFQETASDVINLLVEIEMTLCNGRNG